MAKAVETAAPTPAKPVQTRVSAENRYPQYDLTESLTVADAVKNRGGNLCSVEQLGGFLGYKSTAGGAYATRVAAAKAFGFIETYQGKYRVTDRGEKALAPVYPGDRERALRDAFMAVPMYRKIYEAHKGRSLPQGLGMQNYLRQTFAIPARRVGAAVKTLLASADQAGYFAATNGQQTHLIEPPVTGTGDGGRSGGAAPPLDPAHAGGGGGRGERPHDQPPGRPPTSRGTLLDGLWEMLPATDGWDQALMADWVALLEMALRVRYKLPKTPPAPGKP